MQPVKYVQSFSSGQITVPKLFRDKLKLPQKFWLKLSLDQDRIIAEPIETKLSKEEYQKKLLTIKGDWFDYQEYLDTRKDVEKQITSRSV